MRTFIDIGGLSLNVMNGGPTCYGKLKHDGDQTIIVGRVGIHPILIAVFYLFLFLAVGLALLAVIVVAADLTAGRGNVENLLITCLLLAAFLAVPTMFYFGLRGQHSRESEALIEFLKTTLEVSD